MLLGDLHCPRARSLIEASVHLPRRGQRWIASFRNEQGRQQWKSTGLTDKSAALLIAQEWEAAARRKRGTAPETPRKALVRARGSGEGDTGLFTQKEVAAILKISERCARATERRAIDKLRRHPALRQLWREWMSGEIGEGTHPRPAWTLNSAEVAAVYDLAQTPVERELLRRLFVYAGVQP